MEVQKDEVIASLRAANEALMRELAETKRMLSQSSGHTVMKTKIEEHQKTTRDALSYVAEVKRERTVYSPRASIASEHFQTLDSSCSDEEKAKVREEKLMDLLR